MNTHAMYTKDNVQVKTINSSPPWTKTAASTTICGGRVPLARYLKIAGCAIAGIAGNVSPPQRVSYPDMHHGTYVPHVPWYMPGSLTSKENVTDIPGACATRNFTYLVWGPSFALQHQWSGKVMLLLSHCFVWAWMHGVQARKITRSRRKSAEFKLTLVRRIFTLLYNVLLQNIVLCNCHSWFKCMKAVICSKDYRHI